MASFKPTKLRIPPQRNKSFLYSGIHYKTYLKAFLFVITLTDASRVPYDHAWSSDSDSQTYLELSQ